MISVKKILIILIISIAIVAICVFIKSSFLTDFLTNKIVEILITLLAINTATSAFVVSKLQDIGTQYKTTFSDTYKEVKFALIEQIVLIIISVIVLTIESSSSFKPYLPQKLSYVFDVVLVFNFVYAIDILRDTGVAMFDILIELEKDEDNPK